MKIFLDSASLNEIKTAASWGFIDGVTTNPTLCSKEKDFGSQAVKEICQIVSGPVSVEAMNIGSVDSLVNEALKLASLHKNVVAKIPCTVEGLKATRVLAGKGIKTNITLVFSANQVLLAARAGATFISPFVGRLDDAGEDGLKMIEESLRIINVYGFSSQIIVASVRSPLTVQKAAAMGAHIATVPFKILEMMVRHPLTDAGIKKFQEDYKKH